MLKTVLKILSIEPKSKKYISRGVYFTFIFKTFEVIPDILYGFMIDAIHKNRGLETIYLLAVLILISWMVNIYFQYSSSLQWKHVARIIQHHFRMNFCLDVLFQEQQYQGKVKENVYEKYRSTNEEIENLKNFLHTTLYECFKVLFSSLIAGVLLFYISPQFLLYAMIPILPTLFLSLSLQKRMNHYYQSLKIAHKKLFNEIEEILANLTTIKDFGVEKRFYSKAEIAASQINEIYIQASPVHSVLAPANRIFIQIGVLGILTHGAIMVYSHQISFGSFAATAFLSRKFLMPLSLIGDVVNKLIQGVTSSKILLEKLSTPPTPTEFVDRFFDLNHKPLESMSIRGLCFSYGQRLITNNIHFEFKSERINVIKGQTGAGKTTLFRLLRRDFLIDSGAIFYGSTDITQYSRSLWRQKMAVVPQGPKLFTASVLDNITLFDSHPNPNALQQALEISLTHLFLSHLPDGIHTIIGPNGVSLSGGQIQSIAIARALYVESEILLLDEPTTGFDLEREKLFLQALRKTLKGKMVIITSHRPQTIDAADSLYELHH